MTRAMKLAITKERRRHSSNLRALGESLLTAAVCEDISPLESAAYQCLKGSPTTPAWSYDVSLLTFRLSNLAGIRPMGASGMIATLSVSLTGRIRDASVDADPFSQLAIDLVLSGTEAKHTVKAAWHFDRHIGQNETRSDIHPLYHVQYGGRQMKQAELGETLLCDAPRILHPPMDAVLAVDFVTSNFAYPGWLALRQDPAYMRLMAASYRLFWQPWFYCMSSFWNEQAHLRWNEHRMLCPSLPEPSIPAFAAHTTSSPKKRSKPKRRK